MIKWLQRTGDIATREITCSKFMTSLLRNRFNVDMTLKNVAEIFNIVHFVSNGLPLVFLSPARKLHWRYSYNVNKTEMESYWEVNDRRCKAFIYLACRNWGSAVRVTLKIGWLCLCSFLQHNMDRTRKEGTQEERWSRVPFFLSLVYIARCRWPLVRSCSIYIEAVGPILAYPYFKEAWWEVGTLLYWILYKKSNYVKLAISLAKVCSNISQASSGNHADEKLTWLHDMNIKWLTLAWNSGGTLTQWNFFT